MICPHCGNDTEKQPSNIATLTLTNNVACNPVIPTFISTVAAANPVSFPQTVNLNIGGAAQSGTVTYIEL